MNFTCAICSELHDLDEISFGADRPSQWDVLTAEEQRRSERAIELEPTDHPLAVQQREGIGRAKLERIVQQLLHEA